MKKLSEQKNGGADLTDLDFIVLEALGLESGFCSSGTNSEILFYRNWGPAL